MIGSIAVGLLAVAAHLPWNSCQPQPAPCQPVPIQFRGEDFSVVAEGFHVEGCQLPLGGGDDPDLAACSCICIDPPYSRFVITGCWPKGTPCQVCCDEVCASACGRRGGFCWG
jgi:hypothetical protein